MSNTLQAMNRRQFMLLTSAAGATIVLAACAPAAAPSDGEDEAAPATDAAASEPQMGGTLRVAFPDPPNEFDPAIMSAFPEYNSGYAMYDGLVRVDANLVPQPALAESPTNPPTAPQMGHRPSSFCSSS